MQTIANTEHLQIIELHDTIFPCDDVPSHHHHERTEEVEKDGKQKGLDDDLGCIFLFKTIHWVTFFLFVLFALLEHSYYNIEKWFCQHLFLSVKQIINKAP